MTLLFVTLGLLIAVMAGLSAWCWSDARADVSAWSSITATVKDELVVFRPSVIADLPEPARRYFRYTIQLGTPLRTVVELTMSGELGLGSREFPNYRPMTARQILAMPQGLVWRLQAGAISGSDGVNGGTSWSRFWLFRLLPVARVSGTADHFRSAFGRVVAESAIWLPAAFLPRPGIRWQAVDRNTARAVVSYRELRQAVDITVAKDGRPERVVISRWSNANPEKTFRLQPFGGYLSAFRHFQGYRLPTCVEGGNFIGSDAYFPFYKIRIDDLRFVEFD